MPRRRDGGAAAAAALPPLLLLALLLVRGRWRCRVPGAARAVEMPDDAAADSIWGGAAVDLDAPDAPPQLQQPATAAAESAPAPASPEKAKPAGGWADHGAPLPVAAVPGSLVGINAQPGTTASVAGNAHGVAQLAPNGAMPVSTMQKLFRRLSADDVPCRGEVECRAAVLSCATSGGQDGCLLARVGLNRASRGSANAGRFPDEASAAIPERPGLTPHEWTRFFEGPVFSVVWTRLDSLPGMRAAMERTLMYQNMSVEEGLALVGCEGIAVLDKCIADAHGLLRFVGHDSEVSWEVWNRVGMLWRASGHAWRAVQCFRKALHLSPDHPDLLLNVAITLKHAGELRSALSIIDEVAPLSPVFTVTRCDLLRAKSLHEAKECIEVFMAAKGTSADFGLALHTRRAIDEGIVDELNAQLMWVAATIAACLLTVARIIGRRMLLISLAVVGTGLAAMLRFHRWIAFSAYQH